MVKSFDTFEEYTENTNTGILYPPKDHSFENIKTILQNLVWMFVKGWPLFLTTSLVIFYASLLSISLWPQIYKGQFKTSVVLSQKSENKIFTDWQKSLADDPEIISILNSEKKHLASQMANPFWRWQKQIQILFIPWSSTLSEIFNTQKPFDRVKQAISWRKEAKNFVFTLQDINPFFLGALAQKAPESLENILQKYDPANTSPASWLAFSDPPFSLKSFSTHRDLSFYISLAFGFLLSFILNYFWSSALKKNEEHDLKMTFPFSVLGLLPQKNEDTSPTVLNDAFELLRTNISMQRSIFAFSSLTLIWPFNSGAQNEFVTRLALDFGKTNKKVLVIETIPESLSKQYACEKHKGLTDFHELIKSAPPHSEKENEIFWKLYEYVFGTEEKFYCMPFGQSQVAKELLFEKYNFRRILNILKKHFSLLILNVPQNIDVSKTLPWTTVNDASLIVANYQKNASVADKDRLKEIACAQRFLLGGILLDVPFTVQGQELVKYAASSVTSIAS